MNLIDLLCGKKVWKCNVLGCEYDVTYSGGVCPRCEYQAKRFKETQKEIDGWFKKYTNSEYLGSLFNYPIPRNENSEEYIFKMLTELLHRRDERIADVINENWKEKLNLPTETTL